MPELNETVQKQKITSFAELISFSNEMGLSLSKRELEFMRTGIENKKVSLDYLQIIINKTAQKKDDIGLQWYDKVLNNANRKNNIVSKYQDKDGNVHVYIREYIIKQSQGAKIGKKFYAANRIDYNSENHKSIAMATNYSLQGLKMQIASYYTQIYLNEVKNELKHDKAQWVSANSSVQNKPDLEMSI